MLKKDNFFIIFLNLIMFAFLFWIVFSFQQNFYLQRHDYLYPYMIFDRNYFEFITSNGRVIPSIIYSLIKVFGFCVLKIHSQDYICGLEAIIKSMVFLMLCFVFSCGFSLNKKYSLSFIFTKENLFILPLSFCLLAVPIYSVYDSYIYFGQIRETVVFFEYFVGLLFYLSFFVCFLYLSFTKKEINLSQKILISLNSFLLGAWGEIYNVSVFFSIIILFVFFNKIKINILKSRNYLYLIIPFFIGLVFFYIFSDYFSGVSIANHPYGDGELFDNIRNYFFDFIYAYFKFLIFDKIFLFFIIVICSLYILKKKNYESNVLLITSLSIIIGYLIMNLFFIIYRENVINYLFLRELNEHIYVIIIEFVIFLFVGYIYANNDKIKHIIQKIIFIFSLCIFLLCINCYINVSKGDFQSRTICYLFEKISLIYNILGESIIMPISFSTEEQYRNGNIYMIYDKYGYFKYDGEYGRPLFSDFILNKYFDKSYITFNEYVENEYEMKFIGIRFVDDKVANQELLKRLKLLNHIKKTKQIKNVKNKKKISFKSLNKYKGLKLTLDDIKNIKINKNNADLLLKLEAYINYRDGNFEQAIDLYNEYLAKNPNDFDALINLGDMYIRTDKIDKAEKMYTILHNLDNNNLTFMHKLLGIYYYNKKDYKKALEICDLMIKTQENMISLYMNKAIILLKLGNMDKAKEIINYVENDNNSIICDFLERYKLESLDEIYSLKNIDLFDMSFYE